MELFSRVKEKDATSARISFFSKAPGATLAASIFQTRKQANNKLKLVGLTSTHRGEGVTTVTYMLVHSLIEYPELKLLIVDAAIHNPKLHVLFGTGQQPGFADLISEKSVILENTLLPIGVKDCFFMPAGVTDTESAVVSHGKVQEVLESLQQNFDLVIFDLPPAGDFPQFIPFFSLLDGIIYVVQAHKTRIGAIRATISRLQNANVNIIGGVLNRKKYYIPKVIYEAV